MGFEYGHGIYEGYPADNCYADPPYQCDEPCGYQQVCVPVAPPPPVVTQEHHIIEHDWECCYVYHRVLWILCLVLVLYSLIATFIALMFPYWLTSNGAAPPATPSYSYYYDYFTTIVPANSGNSGRHRRSQTSASDYGSQSGGTGDVDCGWLMQCPPDKEECDIHSLQDPSKLEWEIGMEAFTFMRFLVPLVMAIHLILIFIFILHLLFPYPTIDALVFAFLNLAAMGYTTIVALDVCNPNGKSVTYGIAFFLWMAALGCAVLILIFIIIMCCTGCHF